MSQPDPTTPAAPPDGPVAVLPDAEVERALVISAHPDDVDFGAAGTIATWTEAGIAVTYCIVTDGQAGGFDVDLPRDRLPEVRRREQRAAAQIAGVEDLRFLGYDDGEVEVSHELVRDLTRLIRQVRPQRMLTQSPERNWRILAASHHDHLATGEASIRALYPAARNPFAFPELLDEGLKPWTVPELWLVTHPQANHVVDVTSAVDRKIAAIRAHESQHPEPETLDPMVRGWLRAAAVSWGMPEDRFAEPFAVYPTA